MTGGIYRRHAANAILASYGTKSGKVSFNDEVTLERKMLLFKAQWRAAVQRGHIDAGRQHRRTIALSLALGAIWLMIAQMSLSAEEPDSVLFRLSERTLKGSRFGPIADFQHALSDAVVACGNIATKADGSLGPKTKVALAAYFACKHENRDATIIDQQLWQGLLPGVAAPDVLQRAFVLSLSHEGTDYDVVQWNYGTDDDSSGLTWGPYGATVGYGNEVRGILLRLQRTNPGLLSSIFGSEFSTLQKLMDAPASAGYALLKSVYTNADRRKTWSADFSLLGSRPEARLAYEWYAFQSNEWLKPQLRRLYSLLPSDQSTEVDFGFFLDLAMHMSVTTKRLERVRSSIAAAEALHPLTPAERRQIISLNLVPSRQAQDRMGRNVVYFVDGVGVKRLSADELKAWRLRSARHASDCGLRDDRVFVPDFLN